MTVLMDWQTVGNTFGQTGSSMALMFEETGLCCTAVHSPHSLYAGFCQVALWEFLWTLGRSPARAQPYLSAGGGTWSSWLVCATSGHASTNINGPDYQKNSSLTRSFPKNKTTSNCKITEKQPLSIV